MKVVYYGNYLRFFERGRTELLRDTGFSYAQLEAMGFMLPVTQAHLRYRRPARYDDLLAIDTSLAWYKKASLRFEYRILKLEDHQELELVTGFTEHGCVDPEGRVTPFPDHLTKALRLLS